MEYYEKHYNGQMLLMDYEGSVQVN
jgi:hypothetical protein